MSEEARRKIDDSRIELAACEADLRTVIDILVPYLRIAAWNGNLEDFDNYADALRNITAAYMHIREVKKTLREILSKEEDKE